MDDNNEFEDVSEVAAEYLQSKEKFCELMSMLRRETGIKWGHTSEEFISRCKQYKDLGEVLEYSVKSLFCILSTGEVLIFVEEPHYVVEYTGCTDKTRIKILTEILTDFKDIKAKEAFIFMHNRERAALGMIVPLPDNKYTISRGSKGELKTFYSLGQEEFIDYHLGTAKLLDEKYGEPTMYLVELSTDSQAETKELWVPSDNLGDPF